MPTKSASAPSVRADFGVLLISDAIVMTFFFVKLAAILAPPQDRQGGVIKVAVYNIPDASWPVTEHIFFKGRTAQYQDLPALEQCLLSSRYDGGS